MLSQDRRDKYLRQNELHPSKFKAQKFPSEYIADTTALTPDGDTMDGWYFNEFVPAGR